VAGPSWLGGAFAAVMIVIALYSAGRLAASRWQRRETELDADGVHVVMGVAMAGMLVPRLSPLPASAWEAVFGIAAAWFAWQAIPVRRGNTRAGWRCAHPMPHLVECLAMLYMLVAVPGSRAAGQGAGMQMAGMGASAGAAGSFPALAAVLAIFMIGYLAWAADQLTSLATGRTVRTPRTGPDPASRQATRHSASTASVMVAEGTCLTAGAEGARAADPAGRPMLAPRLSACTKIAMSLGMGYMLILML
jgi:hypothetical protein